MTSNVLLTPTAAARAMSVARRVHEKMNLVLGLYSLLELQYMHEGHRDGHVTQLLTEELHAVELELSNAVDALTLEELPF